jgi:hypothetical protein
VSYGPDETAPDLLAVRADDALLDALGGSDRKVADELGQAELNTLLLSWSREVDSEPMPELVDLDTAVATIKAAKAAHPGRRERRRKLLVPVAAAAAVLGVTFGGASIAARDAQPGDTLWGLTKVLYADKASSVEASYDVRAEFKRARDALADGELDMARDALNKARQSLQDVDAEENHDGLQQEHENLSDWLDSGGGQGNNDDPATPDENPSSSDPGSTTTPPDSSTDPTTTPPSSSTTDPPSSTTPPTSSSDEGQSSTDGSRTDEGAVAPNGDVNGVSNEDAGAAEPTQETLPAN